jgi:hypothetical protein
MANWIFPVIGATKWSGGSWMPNMLNHRGRTHAAIDIYATRGQSVIAPVSGTVKNFGSGNIGGNWIQIQGNDGNVYYFAHMDQPVTLKRNQTVSPGTQIGIVGNTGSASTTSPHVHFSVKRDGKAISPIKMLQDGIVVPAIEEPNPVFEDRTPTRSARDRLYTKLGFTNSGGSEPGDFDTSPPAWIQQLEDYRNELSTSPSESPIKQRASEMMHGTLRGMSAMTKASGFGSQVTLPDTGIDEGMNTVTREAGRS